MHLLRFQLYEQTNELIQTKIIHSLLLLLFKDRINFWKNDSRLEDQIHPHYKFLSSLH